jgi:hypothetical protein
MAEGTLAILPAQFFGGYMSFPSALAQVKAGATPEAALLFAMEHDTPIGFKALVALADAVKNGTVCACCMIKQQLGLQHAEYVLRKETIGEGAAVDFTPDSDVGRQIARLMTDVARPLMERHIGLCLGFANCCKVIVSPKQEDVRFTIADQIRWQESIDC